MLKTIQKFFTEALQTPESEPVVNIGLAAAALLVELIYTDDKVLKEEKDKLFDILQEEFGVESKDIDELVTLAEQEIKESNDLYQFTRLINDNYTYEQKCTLIKALWQIAYADDELDKYEESTIRKIADLIYVDHSDFIKAKLAVNAIS